MAGILDFIGGGAPQGGILGGQMQPTPGWANSIGLFGAALSDAGANLNGNPGAAINLSRFRQMQQQDQLRQAYALAANGDASQRPQAYAAILAAGGDPSALQHAQAQQALPQLMQNLQPSEGFNDNPVGVTPAVNAAGPGVDPARAAALQTNSAPAMSMQPATFAGALQRTGSPELTAEYAPQMIQSQLAAQAKLLEPYTIKPGEHRQIGGRDIASLPEIKIAPNGQAYDAGSIQPGAVFNDPNKAFGIGPDGQPIANKAAQDFDIRKATAGAQLRLANSVGAGIDIHDPIVQSYKHNIQSGAANLQNVPQRYRGATSMALDEDGPQKFTPTSMQRFTLAASRITAPYTNMSGYKLTSDALPYLARIDAASKVPGSVSDQDILDSLTKLNTGGNAVTDAQIKIITDGKSYSDWASTIANKFKNGGVLSDNQRQQIKEIASNIYDNYRKSYAPIYKQAADKLETAGIPKQFWTIPDLDNLGEQQMANLGLPGGKPSVAAPAPSPQNLPRLPSKPAGGWGKATVVTP